jgi:spore germination protein Q
MSKNQNNLGSYGSPSYDTGENPHTEAARQGGAPGGFPTMQPAGFPQGQFGGMPFAPFGPEQGQPGGMPFAPFGPGQGQPMPGMMPQGFPGMFPQGMPGGQMGMQPPLVPSGGPFPGTQAPFQEESYIENILRLNRGKLATVYMTFENNKEWNAKVFRGIVEAAGRDHIVLRDPETGRRYLLLMIYLDYVTFDEELNYEYPFA